MNLHCDLISPMTKVFPSAGKFEPFPNKLTGLRGEILSFQLACRWTGDWRAWGKLELSSPLKEHIRLRQVKLVPCQYPVHPQPGRHDPGYLTTQPGLYPDLLTELPTPGFDLIAYQTRSIWVDVELPEDIAPGEYPISLTLTAGEEAQTVSITCRVLDIALPKLPALHTEWFHSDCLMNYYGLDAFSPRYWEIVEGFVASAVKYGMNMLLTPVFTPPLDTAVGGERPTVQLVDVERSGREYRFGFDKLRRWVEMAKRCGVEYFEISHLFSQWGAKAAPKVMATVDGAYRRLFGWDTDAAGEEYRTFLHAFLTALKRELSALEVLDRCWFHVSDEPSRDHLDSYRQALEGVREDLSGCNLMDALSDYGFYKEGLVREPVCSVDHIEPFLEDRPERLWCYYCTSQCVDVPNRFIALPGFRTRILGALMYKYQIDGFLHWGFNFYNSQNSLYPVDPYRVTDADGSFPAGDPFLVYPGPDGRPESSQRQLLVYEAMADLRALYALEGLIGREKTLALIEEPITFKSFPQSEGYILGLRQRVNEAIAEAINN